jgi:hypothetical protein
MKTAPLLAAAAFIFTACDEKKAEDAKTKTAEAAKSIGELATDTGKKALEKGKELSKTAGEKFKEVKEAVVAKSSPAVESFKARINGFSETMKGMEGQAGDDPAKAKQMLTSLMQKLNSIPTDGLPPDLAEAFRNYHANVRRILELSLSVPSDPKEAEQWQMDHANELHKIEQDSTAALKALKESAARHGITGLNLGESKE